MTKPHDDDVEGGGVTIGDKTRIGMRWFFGVLGLVVGAQFWGHEQVDSIKEGMRTFEKSIDNLSVHVGKLDDIMRDGVRQAEFSAFKRDVRSWVMLYKARNPSLERAGLIPDFEDR